MKPKGGIFFAIKAISTEALDSLPGMLMKSGNGTNCAGTFSPNKKKKMKLLSLIIVV